MKHIQTYNDFLNEAKQRHPFYKRSSFYIPDHIKLIKKLYSVFNDEHEWYDWSEKPGKKMNFQLKPGEELFYSHTDLRKEKNGFDSHYLIFNDKNGKVAAEFSPSELENLITDELIEIITNEKW